MNLTTCVQVLETSILDAYLIILHYKSFTWRGKYEKIRIIQININCAKHEGRKTHVMAHIYKYHIPLESIRSYCAISELSKRPY